jgi:hypothetical protein
MGTRGEIAARKGLPVKLQSPRITIKAVPERIFTEGERGPFGITIIGMGIVAMAKEMLAEFFGEPAALLRVNLKQSLEDVIFGSGCGGAKSFVSLVTGGNQFMHQAAAAVDRPG